ncbi:ScbR family autoregulator-binding transcription factor [Streptomyces sp. NPDC057694]|uniref:ScbR family autoregulator-binding transcription factor n=1 Tax=Streptomyces sp. NPDC057694 TaxID=3346216 RepID=UPI00367CAC53
MVKQERAARTRCALIRAAAEVFAEEGFVAASLSTISKRAGVSNGALHFHFASKRALAEAVEAEAAATLLRVLERARVPGDNSLQRLVDATHDLMGLLARDVVMRSGFELAADLARHAESPLRRQWQSWVEDALRGAERNGVLADGVSWTAGASVIVAATTGFEVLGGTDASWLSRQTVTRFWELLLPRLVDRRDLEALVCVGSQQAEQTDT